MPRLLFFLFTALPAIALAQHAQKAISLAPMVVTATRSAQWSFDLPLSIDQLTSVAIREDQPLANMSEALVRVPGVIAQNRQNYAQDLQISSRGFGARSTFGVRGVRIYVDGIPATMPDGQGQVSHIDLGSSNRIEVMRGPFSALYGNSSGGVIAVFTENGKPGWNMQGDVETGSFGSIRTGLKVSGQQNGVNHVESVSRFSTDGYREHSAAQRTTGNAKLRFVLDDKSSLALVGNAVQMQEVDDPLGLSRTQFDANPRGVNASALLFNTRKSVDQQQIGLTYERHFDSDDNVQVKLYGGRRTTMQFQAIPLTAQTPPTSAGGVIDLQRQYSGIDFRLTRKCELAGKPCEWTFGASYDQLDEDRRGYENFIGATLGVQGRLRRDEANRVFNFDQYVQAQWEPHSRWLLAAGLRNSVIHFRSDDRYVTTGNGNDSGSVRYAAATPVLGVTHRLSPALNLYASWGKGFETPTFNELSYRSTSGTVTGLNFGLQAAKSEHAELGLKALIGTQATLNAALFHIDTDNELTVLTNSGGRSVYQNAGKTRRDGAELQFNTRWENGIELYAAYSWLKAEYAESFCSGACAVATRVAAGNRIPGMPRQSWFGELSWRHARSGFHAALETRYVSRVYVDDINSDTAPAYFAVNVRAGLEKKVGRWTGKLFARIDNLGDRRYAGSVIVNESNRRFFEPAPGRNFLAGASLAHQW
ncbi:MAG: TonB-dependent receptor [Burkholderiales bacterium]|nr:TonB-dependent receptor [Burkholderiales bacterium]